MSSDQNRPYSVPEVEVSGALRALWDTADSRADDELAELCKRALDALYLPWVPIRAGERRAHVRGA